MNIVPDTNVLIAALLNPLGTPARILDLVISGQVAVSYDDRILAEYRQVISRAKFDFDREFVADVLEYLVGEGRLVSPLPLKVRLPDPDDLAFLEVACEDRVFALVTGNTRHYPRGARSGVTVLTPAEFLERWQARRSGRDRSG